MVARRLLIIIITVLYISGMVSPFYAYVEYALNRDYISANLCENKDKPEMHCDGKCFLMDQLAKTVEAEQKSTPANQPITTMRDFAPHQISEFCFRFNSISCSIVGAPEEHFQLLTGVPLTIAIPPEFVS